MVIPRWHALLKASIRESLDALLQAAWRAQSEIGYVVDCTYFTLLRSHPYVLRRHLRSKMKKATLILAFAMLSAMSAEAAILKPAEFDPAQYLPAPPAEGSPRAKAEMAEVRAYLASNTPEEFAAATRDALDETPDIFNNVLGFDIATRPQTYKLLQLVVAEEDEDSKVAKKYFHRLRPYAVDPTLKTCTPAPKGKGDNSYPSGHVTLGYSMGIVLAAVLPAKSQAILARSAEFAEHRIVCGVHFRSDIAAGQQFGTILAVRLMDNQIFRAQMAKAATELSQITH